MSPLLVILQLLLLLLYIISSHWNNIKAGATCERKYSCIKDAPCILISVRIKPMVAF